MQESYQGLKDSLWFRYDCEISPPLTICRSRFVLECHKNLICSKFFSISFWFPGFCFSAWWGSSSCPSWPSWCETDQAFWRPGFLPGYPTGGSLQARALPLLGKLECAQETYYREKSMYIFGWVGGRVEQRTKATDLSRGLPASGQDSVEVKDLKSINCISVTWCLQKSFFSKNFCHSMRILLPFSLLYQSVKCKIFIVH